MHAIAYRVTPLKPSAHLYQISCFIQQPQQTATQGQVISLPAWIPGSYLIRDFAKNMVSLSAGCNGQSLQLERLTKDSWRCPPCEGAIQLDYEVYAWDPSVRTAQLDSEYGFFNGSSVFLRVHGQEQLSCKVTVDAPQANIKDWSLVTAMQVDKIDEQGFGDFIAANYDEAIDHPFAMGKVCTGCFIAAGVPHEIALFGRQHADMERLCADLTKICEQHIYFFDKQAPVDRYLFIARVVDEGYGGLEHRASTVLICSRESLPQKSDVDVTDKYREFLGLCSHEYFHTWNIKRIKPAAFTPFDLQTENYTELLWAFEGITSYYDDLAMVRSGVITAESYLQLLGQTITRVMRGKGRFKQTLLESSFYAWTKFYQQDENAANAIVSYYTKGALVALCLDLLIRQKSANAKSLDDVMHILWQRYGVNGLTDSSGVPEDGVERITLEVLDAGNDAKKAETVISFFDLALRSTEDLPLQSMLQTVGIMLKARVSEGSSDKGGKPASFSPVKVELGANLNNQLTGIEVISVSTDSAAQAAGLSAGDVIVAYNGLKATLEKLREELRHAEPGDGMLLHVFRRDELMQLTVQLQAAEASTFYLEWDEKATEQQQANRDAWLAG